MRSIERISGNSSNVIGDAVTTQTKFYKKALKRTKKPGRQKMFLSIMEDETYLSDPDNFFIWNEYSIMDGGTQWS